MASIAPPPAPLPAAGPGGGGAVAVAVIGSGPSVDGLAVGAVLEAVAQARATRGLIEAMTPQGPLLLKALPGQTLPPIPEGARLMFQMLAVGGDLRLSLVSVNGRPLMAGPLPGGGGGGAALPILPGGPAMAGLLSSPSPGQPRMAGASAQPPAAAAGGLAPAPGGPVPAGLTATVIRPAVPAPSAGIPAEPTAGLPADLPPGTRLTVRIAGIVPPPARPDPAGPTPPPSAAAPTLLPPAARPPAGAAPPPLTTDTPPPGVAAAAVSPRLLPATVIAHPPGGQAVVQTPVGTLALPTHADLPPGTVLQLELTGSPQPPAAPPPPARPEGPTPAGWPALTDAAATLTGGNDRQSLDLLLRNLPQIGPRLAANISLFANALRSGDIKAVFGEGAAKGLEKAGRKDLADRLKADLEELAADSGRSVAGGDWRGFTLPLVFGQIVDPIRLYVRQPGGGEDGAAARAAGGERFLLDLNLSRLGRIQMDGLVRREDKLFDLIIRTGEPMPEQMRRDIMGIFADAADLVGTKGSVIFQSGGRWVELRPDDAAPTEILA